MRETDAGLHVEVQLDLKDSQQAREVWRLVKRNAVGLSFGYLVTKSRERSDGVTELIELDLFEISLTGAPVNQDARILSTKGVAPDLGLGGILGLDPRVLDQQALDPAERMITIADRDGSPKVVRAGSEFWWERDEREALAEWGRKSRPVMVKTFEC
jgi:Caudovirus prohead serine protease